MRLVKIALYARVSSDKQAQEKTIESQVERIKDFIREAGGQVEPDLIFCDNGVSGSTLVRPALEALRDKAFAGEIERVYILSPDRLARKYIHQLVLVDEFKKLNIEIIFINRALSETPEDQMLLQIQGVISEYEREKIMERTRRGKLYAAKKGKVSVLCCAPFGYIYTKSDQENDAMFVIHPVESEIVKECYDLYCNKFMTMRTIAEVFTKKGYQTRGGNIWRSSTIYGILHNTAYIGQAAFQKTRPAERTKITKFAREHSLHPKALSSIVRPKEEWIWIPVPKIIDPFLFEMVSGRAKESSRFSRRNNKTNTYLVTGLARCHYCGYAIHGQHSNHKGRKGNGFYRCCGQNGSYWPNGKICPAYPIRIEVVDDLVWDATKKLISSPNIVIQEYNSRIEKKKQKNDSDVGILNKKMRELKNAEREKERLLDLYQLGTMELNELEPRLKSMRVRIHRVQQEIDLLKHEAENESKKLHVIQRFEDFCSTISGNLEELSFTERQKIVRLLVTDIIIDVLNAEITVNHILPLNKSNYKLRPRRPPVEALGEP